MGIIKRKTDGTIEKFKARKVTRGYVQEKNLATKYNINHRVTSPTTTSPTCNLEKPMDNEPRCNQTIHRALVGALLHISRFTRPDISITVSLLGRRVEDPSQENLDAARRVLQYL
jgi:hypothetical protein